MQDLINKILEFLGIKTNELPNNQQDTSSGSDISIISTAAASDNSFDGNGSSTSDTGGDSSDGGTD